MEITKNITRSTIFVERRKRELEFDAGIDFLMSELDQRRGAFLSSGVEDPDRYARFDFGFIDPPLELIGRSNRLIARALNERGVRLLAMLEPLLLADAAVSLSARDARSLELEIERGDAVFAEEDRSRQPSLFTPLRSLIAEFKPLDDPFLGLYGAFGYDLIFQFDPMALKLERGNEDRELHLYLADRLFVVDKRLESASAYEYEFAKDGHATLGADETPFDGLPPAAQAPLAMGEISSDHRDEDYMANVELARERMRVGDIFEVVLSRKFSTPYGGAPSALHALMRRINPSPYEFFFQFGQDQLIGASPEMFVRVEGERVESAPISGTARRGANAMEDAERVLALYNSEKDETELTMCTDVDRNDKSRICVPGSVKLSARRFIERYAGLFHTVDHVEGRLREGFDGLDAFLSHMWAVTLTGAPKRMAVRIIEDTESSARRWYGGAVGALLFNGNVNTGITIRTVHLESGSADYRAGSTLIWDSVPADEEMETRIKSTAFFNAMAAMRAPATSSEAAAVATKFEGADIVMVDNEDSFVHTLADYFRQTGANVRTYRNGTALEAALEGDVDLVVHSPGPGRPADFGVPDLVRALAERGVPQFGICLGLQGITEAFGGELAVLEEPRHGKIWRVHHNGEGLFEGIPDQCRFGAYHSLYAVNGKLPEELEVLGRNETGVIMALQHKELPIAAVQFHPESILSMDAEIGHRLIRNALTQLLGARGTSLSAA